MSADAPPTRHPNPIARPIWTLRLFGIQDVGLDRTVTAIAVALLVASRFLLLPSGPWEWDETLFARGVLKFDLSAHFPHPPGFPLWMALGWLVLPLVEEPLRGFQLLSALASCLILWPLAALGRRVAPPAVAAAAALVVLAAPGVWLHAVRGFSSTPAGFLAFWAAALALGGLSGRRLTAFTLLVAAALLVRPILVLPLAALWLGVAAGIRPVRRLVPGVIGSVLAGLLAVAGMIWAQGGVSAFAAAFATHARRHTRNLVHNVGTLPEYGFVKGLGGEWFALCLVVLAGIGLVAWWRRAGRQAAVVWLAVMTIGILQLVHLQGRTFPRYSVPFQMALAPLAAGAAAILAPPAVAVTGLGVIGLALARESYPLVVEQHALRMPGWDAVVVGVEIARRRELEVVVDPGLFPYFSYHERVLRWRGEGLTRPWHLSPASPDHRSLPSGPYLVITDRPDQHFPPLVGTAFRFGHVSRELAALTQGRFLHAAVVENPPLLLEGWWPREHPPGQAPFVWGRPGARLAVPSLPQGSSVVLDLRPAPGDAELVITAGNRPPAVVPGDQPRSPVSLIGTGPDSGTTLNLTFDRAAGYPPGPGDLRPLAVQLLGVYAFGPNLPWRADLGTPLDEVKGGFSLHGFFDPEEFGWGRGRWSLPDASIHLPPLDGEVSLQLAAPRPTDPNLVLTCDGLVLRPRFHDGAEIVTVSLPQPCDPARAGRDGILRLTSAPFRPGGQDPRELGVVVGSLSYRPAASSPVSP